MKEFVSKLIDRNLQRKRESGITSYVLYSVMLFCCYKLFKNIEIFSENIGDLTNNIQNASELTILFGNCYIAFYFILLSFKNRNSIFSYFKIIKYEEENFDFHLFIIRFIYFSLPFILLIYSTNFYIQKISFVNYEIVYQYSTPIKDYKDIYFYILFFLNLLPIVALFNYLLSSTKSEKKLKLNYDSDSEKDYTSDLIIFIVSITIIIFSIYISFKINFSAKIVFFKIITLFYFILYIIEKIIVSKNYDIDTLKLEKFEFEIYKNNMEDNEIRNKFQENYLGFFIDDWIEINQVLINKTKKELLKNNRSLQMKLRKKTLSDDEIKLLKNDIEDFKNSKFNILNNKLKEINGILNDNINSRNLDNNEKEKLLNLKNNTESLIKEIKT